jgi:hypothetical protein
LEVEFDDEEEDPHAGRDEWKRRFCGVNEVVGRRPERVEEHDLMI